MNIKIYKDIQTIGRAAANTFAAQVITKPNSILGLATGSSPLTTYQNLIKLYKEGIVDFSNTITFNLDEYIGLDHNHPASYYRFMQENLFGSINVLQENIHIPNGMNADIDTEGKNYDALIAAVGGIDLQILGIGNNGHIAFNEPCDHFPMGTHKIALSESTITANTRFFAESSDVPRFAVSMGVGSIMKARQIILIAAGSVKADAVYGMVNGPVTPMCPASILQLHPNVTVFVDEAAAAKL